MCVCVCIYVSGVFVCSYSDTEQYEEAVRDYEKVAKMEKTRGTFDTCDSYYYYYSYHPFNGLFSRTTWVSQYQKGETSLDLKEARYYGVLGRQWHQLDHMQTICTSLQTQNHTNTSYSCDNMR